MSLSSETISDVPKSLSSTTLPSWETFQYPQSQLGRLHTEGSQAHLSQPAGLRSPITLDEVLEGRHLPPLSLKDFELFLCYETRSPENLYFLLWFKHYKALHDHCDMNPRLEVQSISELQTSQLLMQHINRAKSTFLEPGSTFELELSVEARRAVLGEPLPLHPFHFSRAKLEVEAMLQTSFETFVLQSHENICRRYRKMAAVLGLFIMTLSFLPLVLLLHFEQSRWFRILGWPPLFVGIALLSTAITGLCPLVYFLTNGNLRQLRQYEQPQEPELSLDLARTISSDSTLQAEDLELGMARKSLPDEPFGSKQTPKRLTAAFITSPSPPTYSSQPPSESCSTFDFDGLPSVTLPKYGSALTPRPLDLPASLAPRNVPCFGPFTKVLSDVTKGAQWARVLQLTMFNVTLATLITTAIMFVPERH